MIDNIKYNLFIQMFHSLPFEYLYCVQRNVPNLPNQIGGMGLHAFDFSAKLPIVHRENNPSIISLWLYDVRAA